MKFDLRYLYYLYNNVIMLLLLSVPASCDSPRLRRGSPIGLLNENLVNALMAFAHKQFSDRHDVWGSFLYTIVLQNRIEWNRIEQNRVEQNRIAFHLNCRSRSKSRSRSGSGGYQKDYLLFFHHTLHWLSYIRN